VSLACLDAEAEVLGKQGSRRIPMTGFHLTQAEAAGSGGDAARDETRLAPGELIMAYRIPIRAGERSAYIKVRERESYEYALVSAAAAVRLDNGVIGAARIALGSVAQKPWRLPAAEAALVGQPLTRDAVLPPIRAGLAEARALDHNAYKIEMAGNAAMRALLAAGGKA
jgi:xanthine dehydrogenase YagS FAD-binding subunit